MRRSLVLALLFTMPFLSLAQEADAPDFVLFLGRMHPMLLHLPIGFLALTFVLEIADRIPRYQGLGKATEISLVLSAASSVLTVILGFFLSLEGGYGEDLLNLHRNLGIATTALCLILLFMKFNHDKNPFMKKLYPGTFLLTMLLLTGTGHFGGSLTHGEDYLTYYLNRDVEETPAIANIDNAVVFRDLIRPVIDRKCVSCHNTSKTKGDLQLHTIEAIKKGGKNGVVLVSGNPDESHMVERVLLPADHDDHMPPEGKEGMTEMETAFLQWWIESGASFEDSVKNLPKTEEIEALLDKFAKSLARDVNPVFKSSVSEVDEDLIAELDEQGIAISRISEHNNYVSARFWKLPEDPAKALKSVSEQLVWLDLSRTSLTDAQLQDFSSFENIIRLHLNNTNVTTEGAKVVSNFKNLEYLNLYGTGVSNDLIPSLMGLDRLREVFLWDTEVTEDAVSQLRDSNEKVNIEMGIALSALDTIRLSSPIATFERSMFRETTTLELSLSFDDVVIYYTLDGTEPDENSTAYTEPLTISESCVMKAIATKEGWANSNVTEVEFIKVATMPEAITLVNDPSERYAGNGPGTLIDGIKGSNAFSDGKWLGFHQVDYIATVDMGTTMPLKSVRLSFLEDIGAYIFQPQRIQVQVSADGTNYRNAGGERIGIPTMSRPGKTYSYKMDIPAGSDVRYIKITAKSVGLCPDWHPGSGDKAWIFTDEIIVE